jgi:hypothetical protein
VVEHASLQLSNLLYLEQRIKTPLRARIPSEPFRTPDQPSQNQFPMAGPGDDGPFLELHATLKPGGQGPRFGRQRTLVTH